MEYFTSYARNFLLNIIPYNQDKILRTDAITFKVKITQYGRIVFSTNESPSPSPPPCKASQYIPSLFRVSVSRVGGRRGRKKFETSAGIEWFTSNVNHFFSRHAVLHDSARISRKRFVSRSSHLARWISNTSLPHVPTFHSPFPRHGHETPPFFRAEEFISVENFQFCSSPFHRVIARQRGGGKRGTDFEGKLWIFTGRARAYRHSRGHPLKFISEYRWNSTRREGGNRRADRKISLETMFCGKGFGRWGSLLNLKRRDAKGNCRGSTYMGSLLENWGGGDMNF